MTVKSIMTSMLGIGIFVGFLALVNTVDRKATAAPLEQAPNTILLPASNLIETLEVKATPAQQKKVVHQVKASLSRTLLLYGEVASDNSAQIAEGLKHLGSLSTEPILLLINSPGGSVFDGALIVSAIEASPAPVHTICLQICASMAAIIHQYGKERMMVDRSILMFHDASGGLRGSLPQMTTRLNQVTRYVNKLNAGFASRAGMTLDDYNTKIAYERWLDAEDATALRFNDKIVSVTLPNLFKVPQDEATNNLKKSIDLNRK